MAAATGFTRWPTLLAATVAVAVAEIILISFGPGVARQQERERRAEQTNASASRLPRGQRRC